MVKQKIVIQVSMRCDKCRPIALKMVAKADGVISVGITGDCKDRLEVVGEDVDITCLVGCLRKEKLLRPVDILLVEEVKDKKKEEKKEEKRKEEKKAEEKPPSCPCGPYCTCHPIKQPPMLVCQSYCHPICPQPMLVCDEPAYGCSIM